MPTSYLSVSRRKKRYERDIIVVWCVFVCVLSTFPTTRPEMNNKKTLRWSGDVHVMRNGTATRFCSEWLNAWYRVMNIEFQSALNTRCFVFNQFKWNILISKFNQHRSVFMSLAIKKKQRINQFQLLAPNQILKYPFIHLFMLARNIS